MENANKPQGLINAAISRWPIISPVISFLKDRFSIIDLANPDATIEGIKKDIEFRGFSLWILIFSIFIASIGLNVNSTAVVIGAMLISPLMGPIMGLGLSLGINDFKLLTRSLKNLGVAIGSNVQAFISATAGTNANGTRTVSTNAPSGGSDGDIWYKYT